MNTNRLSAGGIITVISLGLAGATTAGVLNPPAGPVSPSMKTLSEVEPRIIVNATNTPGDPDSVYKISLPGSYYLTGDLFGAPGKSVIEIAANDVTLDLSGYAVVGTVGSFYGIFVDFGSSPRGVHIRDGSIRAGAFGGIFAFTMNRSKVSRLSVLGAGGNGISVGDFAEITDCIATDCLGQGITTGVSSLVSRCQATLCTFSGINVSERSRVADCVATSNTNIGIEAGMGSTIERCTTQSNMVYGILANFYSMVAENTARLNGQDGIRVATGCVVRENLCQGNGSDDGGGGGAGIHAIAINNRIENNHVMDNDRGIDVDMGSNVVVRNSAGDNTIDYDVAGGNVLGPIVDSANVAADDHPHGNYRF